MVGFIYSWWNRRETEVTREADSEESKSFPTFIVHVSQYVYTEVCVCVCMCVFLRLFS